MIGLKEDKKAKSKSFFLDTKKNFFNKNHINFLKTFTKNLKKM